jgi:RNA polymerase sigma-70 factor, ECF subfamily
MQPVRDASQGLTIEALYIAYRGLVYRSLYRFTRSHEDAEDLTQETFLRAARALPALKHTENLGGWLYTIAVNLYRDNRHKDGHIQGVPLSDLPRDLADEEGLDVQEIGVLRVSIEHTIRRMIPIHQFIWRAHFLHHYSHQELIALTGLPSKRVYSLVANANNAFRRCYQQEMHP